MLDTAAGGRTGPPAPIRREADPGAAVGRRHAVDAALRQASAGLRVGLDAAARQPPPAQLRPRLRGVRPCRLAGPAADHRRDRRAPGDRHPRQHRCADSASCASVASPPKRSVPTSGAKNEGASPRCMSAWTAAPPPCDKRAALVALFPRCAPARRGVGAVPARLAARSPGAAQDRRQRRAARVDQRGVRIATAGWWTTATPGRRPGRNPDPAAG